MKTCTPLAFLPIFGNSSTRKHMFFGRIQNNIQKISLIEKLAFPLVFVHYTLFELQLADVREIRALENVAPAIKVSMRDFVFSALGSQNPF